MSRVTFETGKPHQEGAAVWARQRLADNGGRRFSSPGDQDGVLLADSVGMGKTWEAIAAAALILYKYDQPQRNRRHVLILCPPNLVSKWEDELVDGSPLHEKIDRWRKKLERTGQAAPARRIHETLTAVMPIRRALDIQTRKQRAKIVLPGGTYIVSQSLIGKKGHRLAALRRTDWDVVIVDEAHSAHARNAIAAIESSRRAPTKILLSATPFQLDPRQWNGLAMNIVKSGSKVLRHADVAAYVEALSAVFEGRSDAGPKPKTVRAASNILSRIAARTVSRGSDRTYSVILLDGTPKPLPDRLDALDDRNVKELLEQLRTDPRNVRDRTFEQSYFSHRIDLALEPDRTFVANQLRRALSQGTDGQVSPRLVALQSWAGRTFAKDIEAMFTRGTAEKTIVFSSLVGRGKGTDVERIRSTLEEAFEAALGIVRRRHGSAWHAQRDSGRERLLNWSDSTAPEIVDALRALATDELACVLAGRVGVFRAMVSNMRKRHRGVQPLVDRLRDLPDRTSFEARTLRRRVQALERSIAPWTSGKQLRTVERYTGKEDRKARDRASTAFRELGPPWVLVASNVGSEGIDLHTYTRRIVHYDLEWNPARMEQREGRGDRLGRKLKGQLEILYCLVPDTYDERMFHQLVARDRWHGVLLGKPALRLRDEDCDAPIMERARLEKLRLDLAP